MDAVAATVVDIDGRLAELYSERARLEGAREALLGPKDKPAEPRRPGGTRARVLQALSPSDELTAGDVAERTGLGRASVSTTLSKLARDGEILKANRGYALKG